ncbi:unnamed protein product [Lymnaea stagnalis]|uniref:SVEP1 n=1 Tax=Lymnaea stagnalis TaxID=6523 RepID=A0AAV2IG92_LYMST
MSQVTYTCLPGFLPSGKNVIECEQTRDWSPTTFSCTPVDCGVPAKIDHGTLAVGSFIYNSLASYQCQQGYTLDGDEDRRCQEDGTWSGGNPVCNPVSCGALAPITNGKVIYNEVTFSSTAEYTCDAGFELRGSPEINCEASGLWAPEPPTCQPRACPMPQDVDFGSYTILGSPVYRSQVNYTCGIGYILTGASMMTCQEDGTWSAAAPVCERIECPDLNSPQNGSVTVFGKTYTSVAGYSCSRDYKISGVDTRICQINGTWSNEAPTCLSTKCSSPNTVSNGRLDFKDLSIGSIVRYSCDRGYILEGDASRRCQDDLTLTGQEPICQPVDCGELGSLDNGAISLPDQKTIYNTVAMLSCNQGYTLKGDKSIKCEAGGKWSSKVFSCAPVECTKVSSVISNGKTNGTNSTYGAVIAYECDVGFKLQGAAIRRCLSSGNWDAPIPICETVECPAPKLSHGTISSFQRTYGTVVDFSCRGSYRLEGASRRTCTATGEWSGDEPKCLKINCKAPDRVSHSESEVLNETAIKYECHRGYTLLGAAVRTCGSDEIWRPAAPICQIVSCPDLSQDVLEDGNITYSANTFEEFVSYTCKTGYRLRGDEKRRCQASGLWESQKPSCEIVSCGHPGLVSNGHIEGDDYSFNSTVSFLCNKGFKLVGANVLICLASGRWGSDLPYCDRITCPELDFPIGTVTILSSFYDGIAEYSCNKGYQVVGNKERKCLETGEWSGNVPNCTVVFCPMPAPIEHAILESNTTGLGAELFYTCEEGYNLFGDFTRVCQQNGNWSNEPPVCSPVNCPEPSWPENGIYLGESGTYQSLITYECLEGYELFGSVGRVCQANTTWSGTDPECRKISCGSPPTIENAFILQQDDDLYESQVVYDCVEGYSASGQDLTSCLSNRTWSYLDLTCTILSCPTIDIPNAVFNGSSLTYETNVSISCREGYNLAGVSHIICTADGSWSHAYPSCLLVQCPQLGELRFGTVASTSNDYGSSATFSCNTGYNLVGVQQVECLSAGAWSAAMPSCQIVTCQAPQSPVPNGRLVSPKVEYYYQDQISYICDYGYELSGQNLMTCLAIGQFDSTPPACVRIPCPTPESIEFGQFTFEDSLTVGYECQIGYEIAGNSRLTCLLGGAWSGLAPACVPVICPTPSQIENGFIEGDNFTFGDSIVYKCYLGYQLEGDSTRVCQANRSWSHSEPQCNPISCGPPTEPFENGVISGEYIFGSGVEYFCSPGFELAGESFRQCQADGSWENSKHECIRLSCLAPTSIPFGVISGSSYLFEDNITYSCNPGYFLQGESVRTCLSSLEWSGQEPACVRISCGTPFSLENGQVLGSSYLYLDQVNLTCNFGYRLVGVNSSVCDASGLWSGGLTICEQILCLSPPVINQGRIVRDVNMGKYVVQSLVGYECDVGYTMNGTAEKICQETGNWSGNPISCHPVSCRSITNIDYGTVLGSAYIYLSVLNFTCNHGFELVGSSSLQCDHTGSWSAQKPYCKVMSCPTLTVVNGYANINPGDGSDIVPADQRNSTYIYKDVATFFCNEGYEIVGELTSQCQVDSAWSNTNTTCLAVQCPKPEIQNAVVSNASLTFGSVVTITCHSGYDLIGESELTCGADKNWIESLPQCVLLACGSPPSVVNAIIVGDSFKQGDAISYKCRPGYEAVGNTVIVCGLANQWLGTLPTCMEVDCGPPPVFPASTVTVATTTYRSFAEVLCNSGYVLNGNGTLVCSADRTWRYDPNLRCDPRDCGQPPDIDHSSFAVDDTTLGGVAVYMCATGYLMMGGSSLFCDEDGAWRQEYPKCSPLDCSTPPDVPNANLLSAGTLYLDKVEYACHTGYKLATSNATELVCGEMALWEGEIPVCEVVNCGWPSQVLDSYYFLDNNRTDYLSLAVYHCNAGYTSPLPDNVLTCNAFGVWEGELISCAPVDCSDYPQLLKGQYSPGNGTKYQSVVRYDCVSGYVKTGPDVIICLETGKWSSDDHACLPVDCQDPPSIENGDIDFNETTFQSRVTYSCLPGFYLGGKDNIECLESGLWSSSVPTCVPVDCKTPSSIEHGWANYTSSTFQNLAIYSCHPGYTLGPHSTLICGETGEWQGIEPHCVIVNCTEPVPKPNGSVVYTTLTYQSVALFTCDPGFRLEGRTTLSCTETGQWSDESPPCSPLDCSNPIKINHGDVVVSGTTFGASAAYSCHVGYTLVGQHQIYCNEQGAWNSSAPSCEVVDCRTPSGLDNGEVIFSSTTYLSLATYSCSNGFKLNGQSTVVCMESGSWFSSEEAKCEPVTCPEPTVIAHGEVTYTELKVGLTAVYQCLAGYVMLGTGALLCGEDGSWQGNVPTCQLIVCPSPPDIMNGYILSSSMRVGATVEYVCSTGFIHDGVTSIECLADGMWSSELPVCKRIKCAAPPVIANSIVTADTGRSVTSRVTFSCLKGYQMINDKDIEITITCGDDGDWHGKIPSCEIVVCYDPPPTIPFSTFVTTGNTYTSEAIYTCNVGYTIAGSNKIMCSHVGQWLTDDPPQCVPISCSQPREFPLSTFEGTEFTFGKSVNYTCIPGHDLTGSSTSYCNFDGQWSTVVFQCTVRHCGSLVAVPENGEIISGPENGPYIVGSVITFKCLGEYSLVGPASMRCAETGEWDASPPQCQSIIELCSETLIMDNIHPPPPGKLTGNHIIIQCLPGYVAVGNMTSVCQRDGNWTLPQGQCQRVFCDKPVVADTQKVMLLGRSYFYGDKVVFMCRHGFNSVPTPPVLTCLETGRWDAEPLCIAHCKQECLNGGHCLGFNRCKCMTGWGGTSCQIANCILPCLHGGHCVAPYKCRCPLGYEGTRCQKAICSQPCQNGGRCLRPNKCQCPSGFVGDFCESMTLARKRQLNVNIS